jgi:hypothetical protein
MMSMLCNCCVRELLILARTWFAFGLPSKTGCDTRPFQRDSGVFSRTPKVELRPEVIGLCTPYGGRAHRCRRLALAPG